MKFNILEEAKMRELGFTDHTNVSWYLCKRLSKNITFNLLIFKDSSEGDIDVLDELCLQPYPYETMQNETSSIVKEGLEEIIDKLNKAGVIVE
ncbi:hypothetical protein [Bacillus pumilus]|uniref:hypothetical protein n=1 Tax=Bacillus pumilus TaxID=1408 RepID=UPI00227E8E74|nr:hypothetical protein [Bacillus pumilus]MCY7500196.1 hypothetical protein [Bacillus pumilus]MCY7528480.1 hypothetical protein [Bacillus pumilus]MED4439562.1 hypothetical protein [Bacillus pumilus]MED4490005.1 hypothetical protein [Bacillus pumilus]